jgi:MoaD family protein
MVVKLFATVRDIAGEARVELGTLKASGGSERPGGATPATLGELLEALAVRYGPAFRRAVLDGERLRPAVVILINGHNARSSGGLEARLAPTDEVSIFPPLGGG